MQSRTTFDAMKWIRGLVVVLGWLAVLAGSVGVGLHWTDSQRKQIVILASFAPYLMTAGIVGLLALTLARNWIGTAAAGLVVGAALSTQLPVYVASGAAMDGPKLTVMQSNILFGGGDATALVREVGDRDVDVLTVDELTPEGLARLSAAGLDTRLPYRFVEPGRGGSGTGIWSRYPLSGQTSYDGFAMSQLSARAALPDGTSLLVFAFHPIPPYPFGVDRWSDEVVRIRGILEAIPADAGAVVVGADFNATRDHSLYRSLLDGRLEDTADQSGAGLLATYPADRWWPAVIGIDHILVGDGHADNVRAVQIPGSDHKTLVAEIRLRRS